MNRFWHSIIEPVLTQIDFTHVVEVGSGSGMLTKELVKLCQKKNARLTAIEPKPDAVMESLTAEYGSLLTFHKGLSLNILSDLKEYDVVLIDGDPNWFTVYNELKLIDQNCKPDNFPLVLLHGGGWPYGRRDMYYDPETIPTIYRQAYRQQGLLPGDSELQATGGYNSHCFNSIYENNLKNGVLTAWEDFAKECERSLDSHHVSCFGGLAIIWQSDYMHQDTIKSVIESAQLLAQLDKQSIITDIELGRCRSATDELYAAVESVKAARDADQVVIGKLENKIAKLNADLQTSTEAEKNAKEDLIKEHEQVRTLTHHADQLKGELVNKQDEIKSVQARCDALIAELELSRVKSEARHVRLEEEKETLLLRLTECETHYKRCLNQLESANSASEELHMVIKKLEDDHLSFNTLESRVQEQRSYLSSLTNTLAKRDRALQHFKQQSDFFEQKFSEVHKDLTEVHSSVAYRLAERLSKLRKRYVSPSIWHYLKHSITGRK